jgi:hypothetical protein
MVPLSVIKCVCYSGGLTLIVKLLKRRIVMKKCFVLVSALLLASFLFTSIAGADLTEIKSGK